MIVNEQEEEMVENPKPGLDARSVVEKVQVWLYYDMHQSVEYSESISPGDIAKFSLITLYLNVRAS